MTAPQPIFTQNWSNSISGSIDRCFSVGIPDRPLVSLEIGAFEGRGSLIIADKLCKHPESKLICVDPWNDEYVVGFEKFKDLNGLFKHQYSRFVENTKTNSKIHPIRGTSDDIVPGLAEQIDFAYIDGDHSPEQVYKDGCMVFEKLAPGGYMVFDDYEWVHNGVRCRDGVDKFLAEYGTKVRLVFKAYQVGVQKL